MATELSQFISMLRPFGTSVVVLYGVRELVLILEVLLIMISKVRSATGLPHDYPGAYFLPALGNSRLATPLLVFNADPRKGQTERN